MTEGEGYPMSAVAADRAICETVSKRTQEMAAALKRAPVIPMLVIGLFIFTAIFADVLTRYSPTEPNLDLRLMPPFWVAGGSTAYPLGTDLLGRDLLTRIIYGARVSLTVAIAVIVVAKFVGVVVGLVSGFLGGWVDAVLMRFVDATVSFPGILFAIVLMVVLGGGLWNVVLAISLLHWAHFARVIRGEVLSLKRRDFIAQARVAGCSTFRITAVHLFPNILNTLMVMGTLQVGRVIILEASLSFLGAGIPPPTPAWGQMVAEGRDYITSAWWVGFFPGMAILLVVLAFNFFGDWLRDAFDPKLRQV
jgi:peptide/nickel transport system permease protein